MVKRSLGIAGWTLFLLLVLPRPGSAGLIEVILEMSGPKMYGFSGDCRLLLDGTWASCKASAPVAPLKAAAGAFVAHRPPRVWLSVMGGFYFSADKTVNGHDYDRGDVKMLVLDPMLEVESISWPKDCRGSRTGNCDKVMWQLYHGVLGASYNVLFVKGAPTFSNVGLKLRPFGVVVPITERVGFDFSYDIRLYPRRFTAEDFGRVSLEPEGAGAEAVHALVFGARININ